MVETTENKDGKYLIRDMFLLDESISKKIKDNSLYGN